MLNHTWQAPCDSGRSTRIARFDNVAEFVAMAEKNPYRAGEGFAESQRKEAIHAALYGDERYVPGAMDLLAEVDTALPATNGYTTVRSPYGGRVDFGDWLAGSPTPMRRRTKRIAESGVIKILVAFGPSASLGSSVLIPRGQAIMALVMKIQQTRPVELFLYDETQESNSENPYYFLIGVECQPLSLAHVGWAVSHPGFFRHLGLGAEYECGAEANRWPSDMHVGGYTTRRNCRLGIQPEDVILSSATDWNPLINQPVEWIRAELKRIGIQQD